MTLVAFLSLCTLLTLFFSGSGRMRSAELSGSYVGIGPNGSPRHGYGEMTVTIVGENMNVAIARESGKPALATIPLSSLRRMGIDDVHATLPDTVRRTFRYHVIGWMAADPEEDLGLRFFFQPKPAKGEPSLMVYDVNYPTTPGMLFCAEAIRAGYLDKVIRGTTSGNTSSLARLPDTERIIAAMKNAPPEPEYRKSRFITSDKLVPGWSERRP